MGWELVPPGQTYAGRTQFYTFTRSIDDPDIRNSNQGYEKKTSPAHWSWQSGYLWLGDEVCIKWTNDTDSSFVFKHINIGTVACHSGGKSFWAWGAQMNPCYGYGGYYYCYVRVTNDNGSSYTASDVAESYVENISSSNMISPGRSPGTGGNAAAFRKDFTFREFKIVNSPIIQPSGSAYIHLAAKSINGPASSSVMQFNMDADGVEAVIEPAEEKIIWQYQSDHRWHLIPDFFTKLSDGWNNNK